MVKVEDDPMSPVDGDQYYYDDEEEGEDTDGEGDGDGAAEGSRRGEPPLKKGPWTPDEDNRLGDYVRAHGEGNWNQVRINAGLNRCGKSCRLRWSNHLRPDLKKGPFDDEEVDKILRMHMSWGNKWAKMAALLPGRTDNEIKNYWNTRLKRHQRAGLPIYPEYLVSLASNQDMNFGTPEASHGTKRPNEQNVLGIDDLIHNYFDHNAFHKHTRNMDDPPCPSPVGPNSLPMDAMNPSKLLKSSGYIASDYNSNPPSVQIPDEYEKAGYPSTFNYGMTDNQLAPLGNTIISGRPICDGNLSTSWAALGPMDTELPSIQFANYGFSNAMLCDYPLGSIEQADTLLDSTLLDSPGSLKSESISSQNTGLDAIVHKGDGIVDPIKPQGVFEAPPPRPCNEVLQSNVYTLLHPFSLVPGDEEIEGCPLGEIQASKSPSNVILAESKFYPDTSFTGNHHSSWADIGTADASLEASLLNGNTLLSEDPSISIYIPPINGNSSEEAKLSTAGHELDLVSWDSMPGACNMPDFSNL